MKVKELESMLCVIKENPKDDIIFEIYMTSIENAARVALTTKSRFEVLREGIICGVGCRIGMV